MTTTIHIGDCRDVMAAMEPASIDAIVTDPPYGLEFMGKDWDKLGAVVEHPDDGEGPWGRQNRVRYGKSAKSMQSWHEAWAREAFRVLKPGGHLLAFGGTRTYHRLTVAIEDAGFEIRDCLSWLYGSGFPKSLDVSKAIGKMAGAEREVIGYRKNINRTKRRDEVGAFHASEGGMFRDDREVFADTAPATPDAERWNGWGTALKPAWEPIIVARKPLIGTVAGNVLAHSTGALNIDACRIGDGNDRSSGGPSGMRANGQSYGGFPTHAVSGFERQVGGAGPRT